MSEIKKISILCMFCALLMSPGIAFAAEAGFSVKQEDAGIVTFKDIRLTLPNDMGNVSFFGRDRARFENWNYFTSTTDNDYAFYANQLRLGSRWVHDIFNVNATWQYTQLSNLPTNTSAGAGAGSLYFSNSRNRNSHATFMKYLNIEIKQNKKLFPFDPAIGGWKWYRGLSEVFGRFNYSSGNEMKSDDKKIDWLKSQRIGDRLIGGFEWSQYGRSFDGWKIAKNDDLFQVSVAGFSPTQGGFEERAHRTITDVDVIAVEANIKKAKLIPGMEEQFFYYNYNDQRNIAALTTRLDNTGRVIRAGNQSDLELDTFGGHAVGNYKVGPGTWDVLGWGAYQSGNWFELDQSAYAFAAETGYQLTDAPWKPWLRLGWNYGSGDKNSRDSEHGTFYQMMPTARLYSQSIIYNMMNSSDIFVSLIVKPIEPVTVKTEFHAVDLAEENDRWYLGSGLMHDNISDEFAARASNNQEELGQLLDVAVTWAINSDASLMVYYGHFFGGDVVEKFFTTQKRTDFIYTEFTLNF